VHHTSQDIEDVGEDDEQKRFFESKLKNSYIDNKTRVSDAIPANNEFRLSISRKIESAAKLK
jgi:hypothetical protein